MILSSDRIAFPASSVGTKPPNVQVSYYYGFSSEVGGGFYDRRTTKVQQTRENVKQYDIAKSLNIKTIKDAISLWEADDRPNAVFCIKDSQVYDEKIKT